jgi:luciferase family oxidoreductase group 1
VAVDPDELPAQLDELLGYLSPDDVPRPPFASTTIAIPANVPAPLIFVLSSSGFGAKVASQLGLGLAFAYHMNPRDAVEAVRGYREAFIPSPHRAEPYAILSVAAVCAETETEAEGLAASGELAMLRFAQGKRDLAFPRVEEARGYAWDADENALRRMHRRAPVVGAVDDVAARLRTLKEEAGADEMMLLTMAHDPAARRRSFSLIGGALGALQK